MSEPPYDPIAAELPSGYQALIGYRLSEWGEGSCIVEVDVAPGHLNRAGVVHGGVVSTLVDTAGGLAGCYCPFPGRVRKVVTLSLTICFIGQARAGTLRATGRVSGGGQRIFTSGIELRDEGGALVATGLGTYRYRGGSEAAEGVPIPP